MLQPICNLVENSWQVLLARLCKISVLLWFLNDVGQSRWAKFQCDVEEFLGVLLGIISNNCK